MEMNFNILLFMISTTLFSYFYKHILMTLIMLEFMMINLIINLYFILMYLNSNMFLMSMFISIMVCESVMGLSILVYMIRNSGNDYLKNLSMMKW